MCIIFVLLPVALLVSKLASKVADILNSAHEDNKESGSQGADDDGPLLLQVISSNGMCQHNTTVLTRLWRHLKMMLQSKRGLYW